MLCYSFTIHDHLPPDEVGRFRVWSANSRVRRKCAGITWRHVHVQSRVKYNLYYFRKCIIHEKQTNCASNIENYLKFIAGEFIESLYRHLHLMWWVGRLAPINLITIFIMAPTSFSQSRRSNDVTWRHTMSPRFTQHQKSVTGMRIIGWIKVVGVINSL